MVEPMENACCKFTISYYSIPPLSPEMLMYHTGISNMYLPMEIRRHEKLIDVMYSIPHVPVSSLCKIIG